MTNITEAIERLDQPESATCREIKERLMQIKLFDGPMDGAVYHLDREAQSTNRKPDGLWFDGKDEHGRNVQHQYKDAGTMDEPVGISLRFIYDGQVVDTGIGFETGEANV